jgi:hypothetical protein
MASRWFGQGTLTEEDQFSMVDFLIKIAVLIIKKGKICSSLKATGLSYLVSTNRSTVTELFPLVRIPWFGLCIS